MPSGVYIRKPSKLRIEATAKNFAKGRTKEAREKAVKTITALWTIEKREEARQPTRKFSAGEQMNENLKLEKKEVVASVEPEPNQQPLPKKKHPPCARCKKNKKVTKHHYPLGSKRMAFICAHCYEVVKRQRKRAKSFGHW